MRAETVEQRACHPAHGAVFEIRTDTRRAAEGVAVGRAEAAEHHVWHASSCCYT